ncbi:MAG: macro domain-containing protein [Oculatellaceae cyanobacterium Prado106]|nr:macro domain-containing protein [Oculatellaceae cyanobacterium Prado106]
MIELTQGDILQANAAALVNTVNCVGVMGRGVALQFRQAFPDNFKAYATACKAHQVQPGKMVLYPLDRRSTPQFIINFPTKRHWRDKSRIEDIQSGLVDLIQVIQQQQIPSIAIPPLGCGLGGLHWNDVCPLIMAAFASLPEVSVLLFEPARAFESSPASRRTIALASDVRGQYTATPSLPVPKMTVGRAALLGLMHRYLSAVMDPSVTLLEVHKLLYFLQEAGEPLRLNYQKAHYGPYADNLRHVLNHLQGHFIQGYDNPEDQPDKPLTLAPHAAEQAEVFLAHHEATQRRFDRVVNLIQGFETAFGLELLSTVHWVVTREAATTVAEAITQIHNWNTRKRMFTARHIQVAWDQLHGTGWLGQSL